LIWADIERWLRDPGDVLDDLDGRAERGAQGAIAAAESITLARALDELEEQRDRALDLNIRGRLEDRELDGVLDRIAAEKAELERRVAALEPAESLAVPERALDLLDELRGRLHAGLTDQQRQEIVRLLVRAIVHTSTDDDGRKKTSREVVEYRFPGVVETDTGTGSSRQRAGAEPGTGSTPTRDRHERALKWLAQRLQESRPNSGSSSRNGTP